MACGCGKSSSAEQWSVTLPDGTTQTVTSDVAARQMIAKAGGGVMRRKT